MIRYMYVSEEILTEIINSSNPIQLFNLVRKYTEYIISGNISFEDLSYALEYDYELYYKKSEMLRKIESEKRQKQMDQKGEYIDKIYFKENEIQSKSTNVKSESDMDLKWKALQIAYGIITAPECDYVYKLENTTLD